MPDREFDRNDTQNTETTSQFDIISALSECGFDHILEKIGSQLDGPSLAKSEMVCRKWNEIIVNGPLWQVLLESNVRFDPQWRRLGSKRGWTKTIRNSASQEVFSQEFYRRLYHQGSEKLLKIQNTQLILFR